MADVERLEFTLRKPRIGWYPKPTIIFNGRGQPAQWGTGTWQVSADRPTEVTVFLYNRVWKFGRAEITIEPGAAAVLVYSAPWLPIGRGRLASASS
jgi:hypothetical protein